MKLILLLTSLLSLQCCSGQEKILIIALPQSSNEVPTSWERREEILPGAFAAIEEASSSVSSNFMLIEANSSSYDFPYSGNVLEFVANLAWEKKVSHIIGIAGVLHSNILAILDRFHLPIVSLIHSRTNEAPNSSNIHYLTASTSTLIESILAFLTEIDSKKIGLITEIEQSYYLMVSHGINAKISISFNEIVQNHHKTSFSGITNKIFASNIHVILLNVGPSTALAMLCEAYKKGLIWPKYVWILHSYRLDDLLRNSVHSNLECIVEKILEGIFIFQLTGEETNLSSYSTHHIMNNGDPGFNPYADLLYHSVWALISSVDNRSFSYSIPVSSQIHFNPGGYKIYIYHNVNKIATFVGTYDGISHTLKNVSKVMFRDSDLAAVSEQYRYLNFLPLPLLCFLFNTILLVLYIYFRNEPSIKSTSVSLSMLIFAGCYVHILFILGLTLNRAYPTQVELCMLIAWLSGNGLGVPLILATILVKMLRVYRIFTTFKILKHSAFLSDCALLLYILLILSPNIMIHLLWTAIDPYRKIIHFLEHSGSITIVATCHSNYFYIWFGLEMSYLILLLIVVVIVAIKSRKIRRAHFKDTKKVNLNIFLTVTIAMHIGFYYLIFTILRLYFASFVILYAVHIFLAFLSQFTLLVPKIWPILRTKIIKPHNILQMDFLHMTSLV